VDNIDTIEDLKEKAVIFTNKYIVEWLYEKFYGSWRWSGHLRTSTL
jgi:hypothetical protein